MSFNNFDSWYQDFEYNSEAALSNSNDSLRSRRRSWSFKTLGPSKLSTATSEIDAGGWEKIPENLLKPENWGSPPSSPKLFSQALKKKVLTAALDYPPREFAGTNSANPKNIHQQFYPDFDSDLVNDRQLDGLPFLIAADSKVKKNRSSPFLAGGNVRASKRGSAVIAGSVGSNKPKLTLSQEWEQSLLSAAYQNPRVAAKAIGQAKISGRILPESMGGFKSFTDIRSRGGDGGGDGGTRHVPTFGQGWNANGGAAGGGQRLGGQSGRYGVPSGGGGGPRFQMSGPGQRLSAGPDGGGGELFSGDPGQPAFTRRTVSEGARTLAGGFYSGVSATNSRKAAAEAAKRRDAATKTQQMRNSAMLKREEYEKEIRKMKRVQEAKERTKRNQKEKDTERMKEIQRKARDMKARNEKDTAIKFKDARELVRDAAARRDATTKDHQYKHAESSKERYATERKKKECAAERKRRAKEEELEAEQVKHDKSKGAKTAKKSIDKQVEKKSKNTRELARHVTRFAAMDKQRKAEKKGMAPAKTPPKLAPTPVKIPVWGSAKTPPKPTPKLASKPTPPKTPSKQAPKSSERSLIFRSKPATKPLSHYSAPKDDDDEDYKPVDEPADPREAVRRAMVVREEAIRTLKPHPVGNSISPTGKVKTPAAK